jgi:folate-binding protein YgfZ
MSDILPHAPADISTDVLESALDALPAPTPTPLAAALRLHAAALAPYCGAETPRAFSSSRDELRALLHAAAVHDLGWRRRVDIFGEDRLRWLNGMLTNAVQALPEHHGNYNFVLNAQGRIQGDCDVFRLPDRLLLHTTAAQLPTLLAHFDRFIIMDDVDLRPVPALTAVGLAGPQAPQVLAALGIAPGAAGEPGLFILQDATLAGISVQLIQTFSPRVPRFELWFASRHTAALWTALTAAGAQPAGLDALEALRVFEAAPLYGVDITGRDLPQETSQTRALHFAKGCYLGQEIVERVRSRGAVHRRFAQFSLSDLPVRLPADLYPTALTATTAEEKPIGRLTSAARLGEAVYALGVARTEALDRRLPLKYEQGTATALDRAPDPQL